MQRKLAWVTDPHLNHTALPAWQRWVDQLIATQPDGIVITGDISEGDDVVFQLTRLVEAVDSVVYFVLGNHDFYQSSLAATRKQAIGVSRNHDGLVYLTDQYPIELSRGVFLLGEDGWGDAVIGDYENSPVRLNDFLLIDDFASVPQESWKRMLQQQGKESALRLRDKLLRLPD